MWREKSIDWMYNERCRKREISCSARLTNCREYAKLNVTTHAAIQPTLSYISLVRCSRAAGIRKPQLCSAAEQRKSKVSRREWRLLWNARPVLLYAKQPFTGKYPADVPLSVPDIRRVRTFTLKGERWRRARKNKGPGGFIGPQPPRNPPLLADRSSRGAKPRAREWMRLARIQVACVRIPLQLPRDTKLATMNENDSGRFGGGKQINCSINITFRDERIVVLLTKTVGTDYERYTPEEYIYLHVYRYYQRLITRL